MMCYIAVALLTSSRRCKRHGQRPVSNPYSRGDDTQLQRKAPNSIHQDANGFRKAAFLGMLALKLTAAKNTESPDEPISKQDCDASIHMSIQYSSVSSYLQSADGTTRGGCVTMPKPRNIKEVRRPCMLSTPRAVVSVIARQEHGC